ncbi:MAG: MoaD/ThiS family protein [Pseudomonadota bacterium]
MKIELKLFASLGRYMPQKKDGKSSEMMEIHEGTRVRDIIDRLGIPENAVKILFLNGIHAKEEDRLKDGDRLAIFPPIAGG